MNNRVLCVDDDPSILAGFQRNLRKRFSLDVAVGGEQGLNTVEANGPYAVVVADMQMPGMNGIEFLTRMQQRAPDTVRIMLTGNADQKTAMDAVNDGNVFRFLTKPCPPEFFAATLEAALSQYKLICTERDIMERTLNGAAKAFSDILSTLDPVGFGFGEKLREYMRTYAQHLRISKAWALELAAMLCHVGYVTIPAPVLAKFRSNLSLKAEEKDMLVRVPRTGSELIANIPRLEDVANIILFQKKNFDGSGFPTDSTRGEEIPIGSRVLRVLIDLIDLENCGLSRGKAIAEMKARAGCYDPQVLESVSVCFDVFVPDPEEAESKIYEVTLTELRVGHQLLDKIETNEGLLLVAAGTVVTPMLREKLQNFASVNDVKKRIRVRAS
jgi:response regulator RpfG family c-di-GMP phosphodiesterase